MPRVAINGFGRTGRQTLKALLERYGDDLEIVAVNDLADNAILAHLLRHDSTYGPFEGEVRYSPGELTLVYYDDDNDQRSIRITTLAEKNPAALPWKELGVDIVIEATGVLNTGDAAQAHLQAGAAKVIATAPSTKDDITICLGVNEGRYDPTIHHVVSNASCTTNCLAPLAKVLNDQFGLRRGLMTAVHSYTADQNLQDNAHADLRRARAAALNIIPTTTGAARAAELVLPELKGRLGAYAIRVPTPTVSLADFAVQLQRGASVEQINEAFREAAESEALEGILGVSEEELVSSDFIGTTYSSVVDLPLTASVGDDLFKIVAWYDNEWGYAMRVADLTAFVADAIEE